ncbi:uncharacterized protein LOC122659624 [Telopea speciosissima]|uniref:uncharacterized protein LOC122659624 n=1 Tax=Telopea speciosissima TaxID=54955 RepID=UPI001CC78524|nr:uncharacterized protein LOC122659624 [Telopea speciosissima]
MSGKNRRGWGSNGSREMRKSSSSSFFSLVKILFNKPSSRGRKSGDGEQLQDTWDETVDLRRVRPSDEDKPRWVADPRIDKKATDFIAKFYETRVSDSDHQTFAVENTQT